jgi:hypothetical protein
MMTFVHRSPARVAALLALLLVASSSIEAQTPPVGTFYIVDAANNPGATHTTISAAVAVAVAHDRIFVRPGVYVEDVVITEGITLVGWNSTTYPLTVPANPSTGPRLQGTLAAVAIDNSQTLVISGLTVVPNGTPGISVGLFNSRGPMILDRMIIENGTLLIQNGEDVLLQDVRIRAPQATPTEAPLSGITVIHSWVQANDLDVIGASAGGEPNTWSAGGAALTVHYPSIVALARPKLIGGSGGGPWITSPSPAGGSAIRALGGIVAIVDDGNSPLHSIDGGNGGDRDATSAASFDSGAGGNAIESVAGYVVNKRPCTLNPGDPGAAAPGGNLGAAGIDWLTSSGGTYITSNEPPALFELTGTTVPGGSVTITFHSAAAGLLCGLGATSDFDLTIFFLTPSVQFSAGKPSAVEFFEIATSDNSSMVSLTVMLPTTLGNLAGASGMFQGADVVNNTAFLSNPAVAVMGF